MNNVNWNDNAKSAVEYFADWLRADYSYIANLDDFYSRLPQTKTVADAVEWHKSKGWGVIWANEDKDCITYGQLGFAFADSKNLQLGRKLVCTHAEFEAYVKEQEKPHFKATRENLEKIARDAQGDFVEVGQESEKWTHTIDGLKVRFLVDGPDEAGEVPVVADDGYYRIFDVDQLEPIKPTISTNEYDILAKYANHLNVDPAEFDQYISENYETVEVTE